MNSIDDFAVQQYMRDIGRYPLVSVEEERALARRIQQGDEPARQTLIQANLRLVVTIAMDFLYRDLPLADLISEGNLGLMKAVERFDPDRGVRFASYAAWWIRQSILKALTMQGRLIRLPFHMHAKVVRMQRTAERIAKVLGRDPLPGELADALGVSEATIGAWQRAAGRPTSLDADDPADDRRPPQETLGDLRAVSPFEECSARQMSEWLASLLERLEPRARAILHWRFGLSGEGELTLKEIGARLKLTRERVRQLQEQALAQLRAAVCAQAA